LEARIQRRLMEEGNYDLCIDRGDDVVAIKEQRNWSEVVPGTTIVMRVILTSRRVEMAYPCPRCGQLNSAARHGPSVDWSVGLFCFCRD